MLESAPTRKEHTVCETCALDCVRTGEHLQIVSVDDEHARIQALRFGMSAGARVQCVTRIPAGPLVIKAGRQEIAVGRLLAKKIQVKRGQEFVSAASPSTSKH